MTRTRSGREWGALALALALLASGAAEAQPKSYRFGAVLPLTGNSATAGEWMRKGTEVAVAEINARGGVNGVPLEVIFEDGQSLARAAVSGFTKLVTVDRVPFSHTALTGVTLALIPIAEKHKVVLMNGGGISPRLGGASPLLFNQIPLGDFQFAVLARHAHDDLKLDRTAILYRNDDYGNGMMDWAKKELPRFRLTVTGAESFEPGSQDFRSQLAKLRTMPEAIGPRYDAFLAAFNARYKIPLPDYAAAGYYDSTEIFAAALHHALGKGWEYTGDNIRKALLEMPPLEGVFGKTQFARDGTVRKAISIKTFRGGKPAVVKAYSLDEVLRMQ